MFRFFVAYGLAVLFFASVVPGVCQGIPGCYPPSFPVHQCAPSRPAPISRTVQVAVPAPCAQPSPYVPVRARSPHSCYAPPCAPPCPTRPVRVRVEVVVRPQKPKSCCNQRFCCENPPVFEPIFYHAAWMLRSAMLAPLGLGERMLGHGMRRQPCPAPVPVACSPCRMSPCAYPVHACPRPALNPIRAVISARCQVHDARTACPA